MINFQLLKIFLLCIYSVRGANPLESSHPYGLNPYYDNSNIYSQQEYLFRVSFNQQLLGVYKSYQEYINSNCLNYTNQCSISILATFIVNEYCVFEPNDFKNGRLFMTHNKIYMTAKDVFNDIMSVYLYISKLIGCEFSPSFDFKNILYDKLEFTIHKEFDFDIRNLDELIRNLRNWPDLTHCIFSLAMNKCFERVQGDKNMYYSILRSYNHVYKDIIRNYIENPSNINLEKSFLRTISIENIQDGEIHCLSKCDCIISKIL